MQRIDRNFERGAEAGRRAQRDGLPAMEAAQAMIATAFDETAACLDFKERVSAALAMGVAHPANKIRYRARANMLRGKSLDAAIAAVERWYKTERKAFQIASIMGRPPTVSLIINAELRLVLRFFRRKGLANEFPAVVDSLCLPRVPPEFLTAAE